ncbi:MAG: Rossmann fold nucleotide-binding protein Smf possibly involved in DNA uptake [uncultured Solirubrobacteraceae bacterium]|uniref:Rossmann fold nucleotide-binding protein Smf possibly involved in DNA uptake n=1 Tax=uncultured Solirubrobacteraceae bacterium TaxID=1162706 RepID=A0A6J4SEP4_9ACTN|nr:MAG: Rossmann fold nucleotide-binding protein Smf possibly involved in DNA uptake [uncultured Solirubrobacteraceae bacterium]
MTIDACDACLRRTDLIAALAGAIDVQWRTRAARSKVLGLPDDDLMGLAPGDGARRRYEAFDPARARERIAGAGLSAACRCAAAYPAALSELPDPPAVVHVGGDAGLLADHDTVAVVGARRASPYGLEVARALGRALAAAQVPVVSGMALGVDSAAHAGALERGGPSVAVLAGGADVAYPASKRRLHAELLDRGCVVSELPPGFNAFRWCFPARNRLIAGLAAVCVVVEAAERSGSLITADFAAELGKPVGAVPGQVTSRLAGGANALLRDGAALVRGGGDVLDLLFAEGGGAGRERPAAEPGDGEPLEPELRRLLDAVEQGGGSLAALASTPEEANAAIRGLTELELRGLVRRGFGGRYVRTA